MALPIRTTIDDIEAVCGYLATKPTGATLAEAKAVLDSKPLDGRKLSALRIWGLIEEDENKLKITDRGRWFVKVETRSDALREVIRHVPPYKGIVERVGHRREESITAAEVAGHWHDHFKGEVSESEKTLNDQAVCFFQIAQGADLGNLIVGRKGRQTRFDFDDDAVRLLVNGTTASTQVNDPQIDSPIESDEVIEEVDVEEGDLDLQETESATNETGGNRVFITHGKNRKILNQVREIVTFGKFEPVVAMEHETAAQPVPMKVMGDMRKCRAAVIHVSAERILHDEEGKEVPQINENVLIEIGAAMALYGDKFVLLVEEGVELPSNLRGLYECRYKGDELNMPATMKLLKAFNEF